LKPSAIFQNPLSFALLATAALTLTLALALPHASVWADFELSKAGLTAEYCEGNRFEAFIRQPVNSWSNLIYFFLGTWIIGTGVQGWRSRAPQNALQAFPAMSLWTGLMLVGLCFGSFFFHASVTRLGQHWDMGFTYAVAWCLVATGGYRWSLILRGDLAGAKPAHRGLWLGVAVGGGLLMTIFKWWIDGKIALPALMLVGLALAVGAYYRLPGRFSGRLLLAGVVALVLAGVFRALDLAKVACDPDSLLQWHALWHVCTGLAAFVFWRMVFGEQVAVLGD
jgi:hypothetical protein